MRTTVEFLEQKSKLFHLLAALALLAVVATLDSLFPPDVSFALLYVLPVSHAAWFISRKAGFAVSILSASALHLSSRAHGVTFSNPLISSWNTLSALALFLIAAFWLSTVKRELGRVTALSQTDFLTGVNSRQTLYEILGNEVARSRRYGCCLTVAYVDLDNLKAINDEFGHAVGDAVLRTVAETIAKHLRALDSVGRLGGDEFVICLPETDHRAARNVMGPLQQALLTAMHDQRWAVTFSIGVVTCIVPRVESVDGLIKMADDLMYSVKTSGKNRIAFSVYDGAMRAA